MGLPGNTKSTHEIQRGVNEVLVESELTAALIRLNPEISQTPALADEVFPFTNSLAELMQHKIS